LHLGAKHSAGQWICTDSYPAEPSNSRGPSSDAETCTSDTAASRKSLRQEISSLTNHFVANLKFCTLRNSQSARAPEDGNGPNQESSNQSQIKGKHAPDACAGGCPGPSVVEKRVRGREPAVAVEERVVLNTAVLLCKHAAHLTFQRGASQRLLPRQRLARPLGPLLVGSARRRRLCASWGGVCGAPAPFLRGRLALLLGACARMKVSRSGSAGARRVAGGSGAAPRCGLWAMRSWERRRGTAAARGCAWDGGQAHRRRGREHSKGVDEG